MDYPHPFPGLGLGWNLEGPQMGKYCSWGALWQSWALLRMCGGHCLGSNTITTAHGTINLRWTKIYANGHQNDGLDHGGHCFR